MSSDAHCPQCDSPVRPLVEQECRKCGQALRGVVWRGLMEIDIVHGGQSWDMARDQIIAALDQAVLLGHSGLKVIHGYGSHSGRSAIRDRALPLLRHLAQRTGGKVAADKVNPGATIVWLN